MNILLRTKCPIKEKIMANYNVSITNGTGSQMMTPGNYTVSATYAPGYDITSLSPTTYTATSPTGTGTFTLTASGTLTIIFNETGAEGGTPITSGNVVMTDQTGDIEYGSAVNIDSTGTAVFNNVPYGSTEAPYTLYFKQLASDTEHNIYPDVFIVGMGSATQTEYILNTHIPTTQSITLSDGTYSGLPVSSAVLDFVENNG